MKVAVSLAEKFFTPLTTIALASAIRGVTIRKNRKRKQFSHFE